MKQLISHRAFSGALQFTVFIGVVIALLLAGLVMLQNTHNFFIEQSKATIENIQLANSGITFLKEQKSLIADTMVVQPLCDVNQKVQVQLTQWGIYEKAMVKTTHRKKIFYKCGLLGSRISSLKRTALHLEDNFKPLVVVGSTIIKGNVFLPGEGVKSGYIAGEGFQGKNLINGTVFKSDNHLPELRYHYKQTIEQLSEITETDREYYLGVEQRQKYINSFLKPTKIWYSENEITLESNQLFGNILIKSDQKIVVQRTAALRDIILIAPIIEIQDDVIGNFQAISTQQLKVGSRCRLNYPSALVLIADKKQNDENQNLDVPLSIADESEVRGSIIYFKNTQENDFKTQVLLNKRSLIKGEIYCEGNLELNGKVLGSVYTRQFIVNKSGTAFINHIYNGQIISDTFPEAFCGLLFVGSSKAVAKWMY